MNTGQSLFQKIRRCRVRMETRLKVSDALKRFKRQCGTPTTLGEEYQFRASCAAMIDTIGCIPPYFVEGAAEIVRKKRQAEMDVNIELTEKGRQEVRP